MVGDQGKVREIRQVAAGFFARVCLGLFSLGSIFQTHPNFDFSHFLHPVVLLPASVRNAGKAGRDDALPGVFRPRMRPNYPPRCGRMPAAGQRQNERRFWTPGIPQVSVFTRRAKKPFAAIAFFCKIFIFNQLIEARKPCNG